MLSDTEASLASFLRRGRDGYREGLWRRVINRRRAADNKEFSISSSKGRAMTKPVGTPEEISWKVPPTRFSVREIDRSGRFSSSFIPRGALILGVSRASSNSRVYAPLSEIIAAFPAFSRTKANVYHALMGDARRSSPRQNARVKASARIFYLSYARVGIVYRYVSLRNADALLPRHGEVTG